ncbi:MAG: helix-turn-helix transcriptional regulator [Candidatus Paceibacterota bacterium]|jgi:transcriptional regulator with XRE-family HTH domain
MDFYELNKKIIESNKNLEKISENKELIFEFEVANLITEARYFSGLTQKQLAELVGTQQPSIARIEKGLALPSLSFLLKIAKAMGTYLIAPKFGFMEEKIKNKTFIFSFSPTKEVLTPLDYYQSIENTFSAKLI